jgi:hypothetical protein
MHPFPNFFSRYQMSAPGADLHSPANLKELMAAEGIEGALMLGRDGQALVDYVGVVEGAYGLFWAAPGPPNPHSPFPSFIEETAHWLGHRKIVGIKLHPLVDAFDPGAPMLDGLYELARAENAPVLLHTGHEFAALPWTVEAAARRHPEVNFVLGHMGLSTIEYVEGAIDVARRHSNVFLETSGMPFTWKIKEAVTSVGEERVMYGSDAPFFSPQLEIEKVRISGLSDSQLERVLGINARALFDVR